MESSGFGYLGHHSGDDTWTDGLLADFGACGAGANEPTVIVEQTAIPSWVLLAAGIWAVMMLLKKGGR